MRIGFVTQLLWERYGPFWQRLFEEAGVEVLFPDEEKALASLDDDRVRSVSGASFRLAVAQALSLAQVDLLVAPSLNPASEARRGGGQDPWVSDFPAALGTIGGLPPVLGVPALLAPEQQTLVVETLQQLIRDPGRVRRVWDRHRAALRHEPVPPPSWTTVAGRKTIGVVGQPWLLRSQLVERVAPEGVTAIGQHRLDPLLLREEGERIDPRMIPTDREVLGAVRHFSRRGSVSELHLVIDETSGADIWLRERALKQSAREIVVRPLTELVSGPEELLVGL
ncbi:MAG TPA: hypothetical protein VF168_01445 [Trueperaceae bacterium]